MGFLILGLSVLSGIGSLVCWIMVLIKVFSDKEDGGVGKGIGALICGLYALIWGWQNAKKHNLKTWMIIWTVCIGIQVLLNVVVGAAMA